MSIEHHHDHRHRPSQNRHAEPDGTGGGRPVSERVVAERRAGWRRSSRRAAMAGGRREPGDSTLWTRRGRGGPSDGVRSQGHPDSAAKLVEFCLTHESGWEIWGWRTWEERRTIQDVLGVVGGRRPGRALDHTFQATGERVGTRLGAHARRGGAGLDRPRS